MQKVLLTLTKISYSLKGNTILDNISTSIQQGDHIGVVGPNGVGKTTLMKIIAGLIRHSGEVISHTQVYYHPQIDKFAIKDSNILEYASKKNERWWETERLLLQIFHKSLDYSKTIKSLSGGELQMLNIAIGISLNPTVLILDEPTNHLDIYAIKQLSNFLKLYSGSYIIVSHNRNFLNNNVNRIWSLQNKSLKVYSGNYDDYINSLNSETENKRRQYNLEVQKIKHLKEVATQKKSQAHSTDQKVERDPYTKKLMGKKARTAMLINKRIKDKIVSIEKNLKPSKLRKAHLELVSNTDDTRRLLLNIEDGQLMINGKNLISKININLKFQDRIAIIGPNGSGKTTLVNAIIGKNNFLHGKIKPHFKKAVYLDQHHKIIDKNETIYNNVSKFNSSITKENIMKQLGNFLFTTENFHKLAGELSGGELTRLAYAMLTSSTIDLLIMDEPTNNLDIDTIKIIENGIKKFDGGVIVISHDLEFLENMVIDKYLEIQDHQLIQKSIEEINLINLPHTAT